MRIHAPNTGLATTARPICARRPRHLTGSRALLAVWNWLGPRDTAILLAACSAHRCPRDRGSGLRVAHTRRQRPAERTQTAQGSGACPIHLLSPAHARASHGAAPCCPHTGALGRCGAPRARAGPRRRARAVRIGAAHQARRTPGALQCRRDIHCRALRRGPARSRFRHETRRASRPRCDPRSGARAPARAGATVVCTGRCAQAIARAAGRGSGGSRELHLGAGGIAYAHHRTAGETR